MTEVRVPKPTRSAIFGAERGEIQGIEGEADRSCDFVL